MSKGMAQPLALAVVGAGFMARRRTEAFLATGRVAICGVAAAHAERARSFGDTVGCQFCVDDYRRLAEAAPQAVLVEVPHHVQDEIVLWALEAGLHVLVGGPLSASVAGGEAIFAAAESRGLVVEAGFEARYKSAWEEPRRRMAAGEIGRPVAVRSIALWDGKPESWYYHERESGGMPLTHMTYCFLNPLRWLFGDPTHVAAFANRKKHTAAALVREETCVTSLRFPDEVLGSLVAGFVLPGGTATWNLEILGTEGMLEIAPTEMDAGGYTLYRGGRRVEEVDCSSDQDAFQRQAETFLDAVAGDDRCRNRPADTLGDLRVAEAIVTAVREGRTVALDALNPKPKP